MLTRMVVQSLPSLDNGAGSEKRKPIKTGSSLILYIYINAKGLANKVSNQRLHTHTTHNNGISGNSFLLFTFIISDTSSVKQTFLDAPNIVVFPTEAFKGSRKPCGCRQSVERYSEIE